MILRDKLIDFANNLVHHKELFNWYYGQQADFSNHQLNNTLRWKIVLKLFGTHSLSIEEKHSLLEDMKKRDLSDTMINKKLTCEALVANHAALQDIYNNYFKKENSLSITNTVNQMRGFNHEFH